MKKKSTALRKLRAAETNREAMILDRIREDAMRSPGAKAGPSVNVAVRGRASNRAARP